jgi:hypothetical protein
MARGSRDRCYRGPVYDSKEDEGVHYVRVFNVSNRGRYSLSIGKRGRLTSFSPLGAIAKVRSLDGWHFK